jgi:hypothetical protein
VPEEKDQIDEAMNLMGGFGRAQKISYVMNTIGQAGAAFIMFCFVFLEKYPAFQCMDETTGRFRSCQREEYCDLPYNRRNVDWNDKESIHNMIEQLDMNCVESWKVGMIGAVFLFGIVVGCVTLARLGDVLGRKPVYLIGLVMHLSLMVGLLLTSNLNLAFLLMFLFGVSLTGRYYVGYTYNLEMQPKSHHVIVSTTMFLSESFVYTFICFYFLYSSRNWKVLQIPNIIMSFAGIVFLCCFPESPRFLLSQRKYYEARKVFAWIGKVNGLSNDEVTQRLATVTFDGEPKPKKANDTPMEETLNEGPEFNKTAET